jgi:hypothetical protein
MRPNLWRAHRGSSAPHKHLLLPIQAADEIKRRFDSGCCVCSNFKKDSIGLSGVCHRRRLFRIELTSPFLTPRPFRLGLGRGGATRLIA